MRPMPMPEGCMEPTAVVPLEPLEGVQPEDDQEEVIVDIQDIQVDRLRIEGLEDADLQQNDDDGQLAGQQADADDTDSDSDGDADQPIRPDVQLAADEAMARKQSFVNWWGCDISKFAAAVVAAAYPVFFFLRKMMLLQLLLQIWGFYINSKLCHCNSKWCTSPSRPARSAAQSAVFKLSPPSYPPRLPFPSIQSSLM